MSILFTEQPLVLNVELAKMIGVNEAIVLQQVDYWIKINKKKQHNFRDGLYWTYNTYDEWKNNDFPFWSESTIKRTFTKLEKEGFLIATNKYNPHKTIKTKWYTINYEFLENKAHEFRTGQNDLMREINVSEETSMEKPCSDASGQNDLMEMSDCPDGNVNLTRSYTENSTKTSTDTNCFIVNNDEINDLFVFYRSLGITKEMFIDKIKETNRGIELGHVQKPIPYLRGTLDNIVRYMQPNQQKEVATELPLYNWLEVK